MGKVRDLAGMRFGRLTVESFAYAKNKAAHWHCSCVCGAKKIVRSNSLLRKTTVSCGCYHKEIIGERSRGLPGGAGLNMLYSSYQRAARRSNICFGLDKSTFRALTSSACTYCGAAPSSVSALHRTKEKDRSDDSISFSSYVYNGLDKIDPTRGYTLDNVVACCKRCNFAKNTVSLDEFIAQIGRQFSWLQSKGWDPLKYLEEGVEKEDTNETINICDNNAT